MQWESYVKHYVQEECYAEPHSAVIEQLHTVLLVQS